MIRMILIASIVLISISCSDDKPKTETILSKETELRSALAKYPDSLLLIENLVQYYRDNGNYDSALNITNRAVTSDSNEAMFWDMKATLHFENGDTLESITAYQKLLEIEPLPAHVIALGSIYAQSKDPRALAIADQLLQAPGGSAEKESLLIKGMYYNFTGEKKKAIGYFDECLAIDYTYMLAYREKAIALHDLGMYREALKVLKTSITLQSSFEEGYFWMGMCYEKLNDIDEAIKAYQMAVLYDKNYIEAKEALDRLNKN